MHNQEYYNAITNFAQKLSQSELLKNARIDSSIWADPWMYLHDNTNIQEDNELMGIASELSWNHCCNAVIMALKNLNKLPEKPCH